MSVPKVGDRVRVVAMPDDPDPIPVGSEGVVLAIATIDFGRGDEHQVLVDWDSGRSLALILPHDQVEIINQKEV